MLAAPMDDGEHRHVAVLGDPHSGRTSVLAEVSRRAVEERDRLVVKLRGGDGIALSRSDLVRHLLTSVAETLSEKVGPQAHWYRAWRDRVYLRNTDPAGPDDLLSSALVLAADPTADVDQAILTRDLEVLASVARDSGFAGILICVDDASVLTEDVCLVEELVEVFDAVGFFSLILSGSPAVADHFSEAASRCLERLKPVYLEPFWGPPQILSALRDPLPPNCEYVKDADFDFILDLLNLTAGNPYELMVVADNLWLSCARGEQDAYALTPRLLDRIVPHLALRTGESDALHDGAQAIDSLSDEKVHLALELASLSRLSVREVAVTRLLKDSSGRRVADGRSPEDVTDHLDEEEDRVRSDLEDLEANGVVTLLPDQEGFEIVGGRPAAVLLKYKARGRVGGTRDRFFGQSFLHLVGQPLVQNLVSKARRAIPDADSLGFTITTSDRGIGSRSTRPALRSLTESGDVTRLVRSEAQVLPWSEEKQNEVTELVASDDARVALVCASVNYGSGELEFMELWTVPKDVSHAKLSEVLSGSIEEIRPLIEATGLSWRGVDSAVVSGAHARRAVAVLRRFISLDAVLNLFGAWREGKDESGLDRAIRTTEEAIEVLRIGEDADEARRSELSASLSRLGFLRSLDEDLLEKAQVAFEEAQRVGDADGWVTDWNLANVLARRGDVDGALIRLDKVASDPDRWSNWATLQFFLPGRPPSESIVDVRKAGIAPLVRLQRAVLCKDDDGRLAAIETARKIDDDGVQAVADWTESAGVQVGPSNSDPS
jgi:hypothetical protein